MGRRSFVVLLALAGTACGPSAPSGPDPNQLVLELGGANERLGDVLARVRDQRAGSAPAAPLRSAPAEPGPEAKPTPTPTPTPAPKPPPAARQVRLAKGQTLYGVAKEELGDGNRWKEILTLNGWTEAQAAKLREGTAVKLPER